MSSGITDPAIALQAALLPCIYSAISCYHVFLAPADHWRAPELVKLHELQLQRYQAADSRVWLEDREVRRQMISGKVRLLSGVQ